MSQDLEGRHPKANSNHTRGKSHDPTAVRKYIKHRTDENSHVGNPDKPLSERQRLFVEHWARGETISNAAARAGFSSSATAYALTRTPNVMALKRKLEKKYEEESQMTRKKVMDGFLEAIEMAKLMSEPATMVSGWREIAKMCGYMAPVEHKVKVDVSGNVTMQQLTQLSDAELLEVIQKDAPALPFVEDVTPQTPPEPL